MKFVNTTESGTQNRQILKSGESTKMENALFAWFLPKRTRHTPISGEHIVEIIKVLYQKIYIKGILNDNFRTRSGWLNNFKKKIEIRVLSISREKLSSNEPTVVHFPE